MKKRFFNQTWFLPLFVLSVFPTGRVEGQTVSPVSSRTFLQAPYRYRLDDWAGMDGNRMEVCLRLLDTRVENATLFLRMRMVSENLSMENPVPLPLPVLLAGGEEIRLSARDLRPYFRPGNLQFNGNGKQAFLQSGGMLPDGVYRLSFEAYEAKSGNKVSVQEIPAVFKLVAGEPPLINMPGNGNTLYYGKQESIRFQWTPRHLHVAGFFLTRYTFELARIPEGAANWKEYFHTLPLIARETIEQPYLDYGPASPQLIPGNRYAFRVRARCTNASGENLHIKNDGYSEVFLLHFEEDCPVVPQLRVENIRATSVVINWSEPLEAKEYKLSYRKNGKPDARWFTFKETLPAGTSLARLENLEPATGYECRLSVRCAYSQSRNDATYRFTTLSTDNAGLDCGKHDKPDETKPKDQTPLKSLRRFDQIRTADGFVFEIDESTGENGVFSGTGYTHIPLLANTGVKVKFKNIFVNKDYELVSGVIEAEKDKSSL